mmetsp:Transcript_27639/g.89260  ORF Transcript_27639/g.89260 Transcript_27639/m.89260 type:complete len:459 (-) Transcript_27639:1052-2428(-)
MEALQGDRREGPGVGGWNGGYGDRAAVRGACGGSRHPRGYEQLGRSRRVPCLAATDRLMRRGPHLQQHLREPIRPPTLLVCPRLCLPQPRRLVSRPTQQRRVSLGCDGRRVGRGAQLPCLGQSDEPVQGSLRHWLAAPTPRTWQSVRGPPRPPPVDRPPVLLPHAKQLGARVVARQLPGVRRRGRRRRPDRARQRRAQARGLLEHLLDLKQVLHVRQLSERGRAALVDVGAHGARVGILRHTEHGLRTADAGQDSNVPSVLLLERDRLEVLAVHCGEQAELCEHLQPVDHVCGQGGLETAEEAEVGPAVLVHREHHVWVDLRDDRLRDVEEFRQPVSRNIRRETPIHVLHPRPVSPPAAPSAVEGHNLPIGALCQQACGPHHGGEAARGVDGGADEDVRRGEGVEEKGAAGAGAAGGGGDVDVDHTSGPSKGLLERGIAEIPFGAPFECVIVHKAAEG